MITTTVEPLEYHVATVSKLMPAIYPEPTIAVTSLVSRRTSSTENDCDQSIDVVSDVGSLPCSSPSFIRCPCCYSPMDASHTCDNPEDIDNSLSKPEPPDPPSNDTRMDRFNDHMNNPETQEKLKKWMDDGCKTQ